MRRQQRQRRLPRLALAPPRGGRMPIMSSRRAAHNAARRSRPERAERIGFRQPLDGKARNAGDRREPLDRGKAVAARRDEFFQFLFAKPGDEAEAETHGMTPTHFLLRLRGRVGEGVGSSVQSQCAEIDVGGADFDAVRARVAHQLRRLIKAHRLAVEDGGAEHVRIAAFDPRRGVNQKRKARRMAFGKAVFAETLRSGRSNVRQSCGHSRARPCR